MFCKGDSHQYLLADYQAHKQHDGTDDFMYQITRGMTGVEPQLSSAMDTVIEKYLEAKTIPSQCLLKVQRFVINLLYFGSTSERPTHIPTSKVSP